MLQIFGAYECTSEQNRKALKILAARKIALEELITHHLSLDELVEGFELVESHKAMEVVVTSF